MSDVREPVVHDPAHSEPPRDPGIGALVLMVPRLAGQAVVEAARLAGSVVALTAVAVALPLATSGRVMAATGRGLRRSTRALTAATVAMVDGGDRLTDWASTTTPVAPPLALATPHAEEPLPAAIPAAVVATPVVRRPAARRRGATSATRRSAPVRAPRRKRAVLAPLPSAVPAPDPSTTPSPEPPISTPEPLPIKGVDAVEASFGGVETPLTGTPAPFERRSGSRLLLPEEGRPPQASS